MGQIVEFIDSSVDKGIFCCGICENILIPPVMLTADGRNICGVCLSTESQEGLPNTALDEILELVRVGCRYEQEGCQEKFSIVDLKDHEEKCKYYRRPCLMKKCTWSGREVYGEYLSHLMSHKEIMLEGNNDQFSIDCFTEGTESVKVLQTSVGIFLLRFKPVKDKIMYSLLDVHSVNEYENYSFKLELKINTDQTTAYSCKTITSFHEFLAAEQGCASEVPLKCISEQTESESESTVLLVCVKQDDSFEVSAGESELFKCSECKKLLTAPIFKCGAESICLDCDNLRRTIKFCKHRKSGHERNVPLETHVNRMRVPCRYGCKTKPLIRHLYHEEYCLHKTYECCKKAFTIADLMAHISNEHQCFASSALLNCDSSCFEMYFLTSEGIFRLSYLNVSHHEIYSWHVRVIKCEHSVDLYKVHVMLKSNSKGFIMEKPFTGSHEMDCTISVSHKEVEKRLGTLEISEVYIEISKK